MQPKMRGRCRCGESEYTFVASVKFAIQCYCRDCQQISGAGHLPQIAVSAGEFEVLGKIKTYQSESDAG
ncbi:MAG: GFA family protein, partial [Silicimonas sp.]|nr:GFA family protein [Silicimonas sp.]